MNCNNTHSGEALRLKALEILNNLEGFVIGMKLPATPIIIQEYGQNPFLILISCLLSLRTKDVVSLPVSRRLFDLAQTPHDMANLPLDLIEHTIHSVGFYKTKARTIRDVSWHICDRFAQKVPPDESDLLSLPGVGRKTMNLVRSAAFDLPAICVDVHVHRISNRLGLVTTDTPEQTEKALLELLPKEKWSQVNRLLVTLGQNVRIPSIVPVGQCSHCALMLQLNTIGAIKDE